MHRWCGPRRVARRPRSQGRHSDRRAGVPFRRPAPRTRTHGRTDTRVDFRAPLADRPSRPRRRRLPRGDPPAGRCRAPRTTSPLAGAGRVASNPAAIRKSRRESTHVRSGILRPRPRPTRPVRAVGRHSADLPACAAGLPGETGYRALRRPAARAAAPAAAARCARVPVRARNPASSSARPWPHATTAREKADDRARCRDSVRRRRRERPCVPPQVRAPRPPRAAQGRAS